MDLQRQIDYWRTGAEEDLAAARSLLEKGHLRHALFFAHLAVEKMLKAHVVRQTTSVPPKIHNLVRLVEIAGLSLSPEQTASLRRFNIYQLEGRYPDTGQMPLGLETTHDRLSWAEETVKWLKSQL